MTQKTPPPRSSKVEALDWLIEQFPKAFSKQASQVKPLKIGIYEDILDLYHRLDYPPLTKKSLRDGLNHYSASKAYLRCQKVNSMRVDLFGEPVEPVTEDQALYAQQRQQERSKPPQPPSS